MMGICCLRKYSVVLKRERVTGITGKMRSPGQEIPEMQAEISPDVFLVGAALILIYQAARFGNIYAEDPVTSRYVSLLPGAGVRDFAGPNAYNWALVAFLVASLIVYSLLCMISPNVLVGAVKLLTDNADAEKIAQGVPLPLYIAALFMGLTQPIIPGLSQFQVVATELLSRSDRGSTAHH